MRLSKRISKEDFLHLWMMFYTKREIPYWIPQDIKDKIATLM
jgi:CO dehydrogenase/acetyl-CoA synthase beta subunit